MKDIRISHSEGTTILSQKIIKSIYIKDSSKTIIIETIDSDIEIIYNDIKHFQEEVGNTFEAPIKFNKVFNIYRFSYMLNPYDDATYLVKGQEYKKGDVNEFK